MGISNSDRCLSGIKNAGRLPVRCLKRPDNHTRSYGVRTDSGPTAPSARSTAKPVPSVYRVHSAARPCSPSAASLPRVLTPGGCWSCHMHNSPAVSFGSIRCAGVALLMRGTAFMVDLLHPDLVVNALTRLRLIRADHLLLPPVARADIPQREGLAIGGLHLTHRSGRRSV
jgi:hypothetical protein